MKDQHLVIKNQHLVMNFPSFFMSLFLCTRHLFLKTFFKKVDNLVFQGFSAVDSKVFNCTGFVYNNKNYIIFAKEIKKDEMLHLAEKFNQMAYFAKE